MAPVSETIALPKTGTTNHLELTLKKYSLTVIEMKLDTNQE